MAGPFNPARGRGQRGGTPTATQGNRGSFRGTTSHPRGSGTRGQPRGSVRGVRGGFRGRGNGNGTPPSRSSTPVSNSSQSESTNSPFAQLHKPSAPFGQAPAPQKSPFTGFGQASTAQGPTNQWQAKPLGGNSAASSRTPFASAGKASSTMSYQERYDQLKIDRANQRQQAIKDGQMADPNQPTSLNKAITPVGTCDQMCPEFERVERIVQKMVDKSEKYLDDSTNSMQTMETRMLKRFRRSAAGYDEQLPSDIRTPKALLQTTNYLIRSIIGGHEPLGIIHKFVWDRTRSVRNDFSVQQVTQEHDVKIAVTCLERIARFHIVSLHLLSSPANEEQFDRHQEREQLNNSMLSLMYYYDDNRGRIRFPNEDEFRAYYIIFSIHDQRPDLEARVQKWPAWLLNSDRVKVALELYAAACNTWEYQGTLDARRPNAIAQGFYARFFNIIDSPSVSYLMACVAEIYFSYVRQTTIRAIWKGYCRSPASQQHKNEEWTVDQLTRALHFDDDDQTLQFCEENDLQLSENSEGQLYLNWGTRPVDSIGFSPSSEHSFSETYVESKRTGRTLVAVILGMNVREAAVMGMIDQNNLHERMQQSSRPVSREPDSLFVSDEDNLTPAPIVETNSTAMDESSSSMFGLPPPSTHHISNAGPNGLAMSSQTSNPFGAPPPASNPFQQTQSPNPFSSIFPKNDQKVNDSGKSPAPVNPFSALATNEIQNTNKADEAPAPNPFSSMFANKVTDSAPAAPKASPKPFGPFDSKSSSPSEISPSLFFPQNPSAGTSAFNQETPQPPTSDTTQPPSSLNSGSSTLKPAPTHSPANSFASSLFPAPKPKETDGSSERPSYSTISSTSNSLFQSGNSLFPSASWAKDGNAANNASSDSTPSPFKFPAAPNPAFSSQPNNIAATEVPQKPTQSLDKSHSAPNLFTASPTSSPSASLFSPAKPLFNFPKAPEKDPSHEETQLALPPPGPVSASPAPQRTTPSTPAEDENSTQANSQNNYPVLATSATESGTKELGQSTASLNASVSLTDPSKPTNKRKFEDGPTVYETEEERQAAWRGLLQRVTENQARKKMREEQQRIEQENNRKRNREEQPQNQSESSSPNSKLLKVSDLAEPPEPPKYSLSKSLMKAIPTLPILDRVKALTERKEPTEAEIKAAEAAKTARQRQIDEDELLFSAARIAAEQLRTGPKIFDPSTDSDQRRFSYSPSSAFSASTPYAKSVSPPVGSHRYQVAYAPDSPLGLGRTLSRTEQRIRSTGAHGLAYKPLDFTAANKDKRESLFRRSR